MADDIRKVAERLYTTVMSRGLLSKGQKLDMLAGAPRDQAKKADDLRALINSPHTDNFLEAVRLEAAAARDERDKYKLAYEKSGETVREMDTLLVRTAKQRDALTEERSGLIAERDVARQAAYDATQGPWLWNEVDDNDLGSMSEGKRRRHSWDWARTYGLKGQLARLVVAARRDTDQVSMLVCGPTPARPDFAVVVIKGHQEVEAFRRWAEGQKIFTPGKPVEGLLQAVEEKGTPQ